MFFVRNGDEGTNFFKFEKVEGGLDLLKFLGGGSGRGLGGGSLGGGERGGQEASGDLMHM